jgi:hypothetical protein
MKKKTLSKNLKSLSKWILKLEQNNYCNYCKYTFYQGSEITVFLFLFIKGVVPYHGQASGPTGRPGLSRHYGPPKFLN